MSTKYTIRPSMTITEKVLRHLERAIVFGSYNPGDRLVERDIAKKIGVSRVPVREALQKLERWGFVTEQKPNGKGREVVALNKKEISEFYDLLMFLEIQAFTNSSLSANKQLKKRLWQLIEQMDAANRNQDAETYREINHKFHHSIVKSENNSRLYKLYNDISKMERWFQNLTLYFPRMEHSNSEHRLLMEAYEAQNLSEIRERYIEHYGHAVKILGDKNKIDLKRLSTSS